MGAAAGRVRSSEVGRLALSRWGLALAAVGAAGVVLRVWVYRSTLGDPNADEAVVGLMARHALHGDPTTFFWGQGYGGSQEALVTVPVFLVLGTTWLALRLVPIALTALAAVLVWRVGRRTIGEPGATVAGALVWIWPAYNVHQLTHQQGFYASNLVYCALLLLLALRLAERPDRTRVGLLALVLGLAFWQTGQIVPVAAGVLAWVVWRQPRALRHLPLAVPLFVLGALPWLLWNLRHDWESLATPYGDKPYGHRLRVFASPLLPMTLGLRVPFSQERVLPAAVTLLALVALGALFVYGAIRARRREASILYAVAAVFPFVYALSPRTLESADPRYLVILTPVLALLVAQLAARYVAGLAVLACAAVLSAVSLHGMMDAWPRVRPSPYPPRDLAPLVAALDRLGVDRVYASYWVAYRLAFETDERIVAVKNDFGGVTFEDGQANPTLGSYIRYRPYEREVREARHGFVFYRATVGSVAIVPALERHGYRRATAGPFVVYAPPPL